MERSKKFTLLVPWDISTVSPTKEFWDWCHNPKASVKWGSDGRYIYIYILSLTDYQKKIA